MSVLFATDGKPHSEKATNYAMEYAKRHETKLFIVFVVSPKTDEDKEKLIQNGMKVLEHLKNEAVAKGVDATTLLEAGSPYEAIISASDRVKADAIIVGTSGKTVLDASPSYAAIDAVAARLIRMHPQDVCTIRAAWARGSLEKDLDEIEVLGERWEDLVVDDFKRPSTYASGKKKRTGAIERNLVKMVRVYALRPAVMHSHCSLCGRCVRSCPTGAMRESRGKVRLSHKKCIRCYTCHEMCTSSAISLERSLGGRAIARVVERKNRPEGR